ncbi:MAG: Coenzyme F420 hydrogenase/dehydrogenase, beta subunit C-terminal domain [Actinomycetota bacterium]
MTNSPTRRLNVIVEQGLCIGCGLCEAIAPESIEVRKATTGFEVPFVTGDLDHATVDRIYDICPGTRIEGLPDRLVADDTSIDAVWGPWRRIVRAWAGDSHVRHVGSTGGVLTALAQYLLTTKRVDFILHAKASVTEPSFGEPTISFSTADVLDAAGSRYGPTATLRTITDALDRNQPFAFIGTPCDISALRNHARHDSRVDELVRYWMTPVCGGFGEPQFTDDFVRGVGIAPEELTSLRYRGFGCPGPTHIESATTAVDVHYLDYWGDDDSQWGLPWRCKICPDGIGEGADLAASDTWPGGSPTRDGSDTDLGVNAIIARTTVGEELLAAAAADGALVIERDIGVDDMSEYQPHQVRKKYEVGMRLDAIGETGRLRPQTARLRIEELAAEHPVEVRRTEMDGTIARIRAGKATLPTPKRASR